MPNNLPLYRFFESLKAEGFPLGIEEYFTFLRALQRPLPLQDTERLFFLCQTLWLKPNQNPTLFRDLFEQAITEEWQSKELQTQNPDAKPPAPEPSTDPKTGQPKDKKEESKPPEEKEEATEAWESEQINISLGNVADNPSAPVMGKSSEAEQYNFLFTQNYWSLNERQMKQNWRFFLEMQAEQKSQEIDLPATIQAVAEQGFFDQPIYKKKFINTSQLVTLIDHHGSMTPFHRLSQSLLQVVEQTLKRYEKETRLHQYFYFENVVEQSLFRDVAHTKSVSLEQFYQAFARQNVSVLIISDAGAARGRMQPERIDTTRAWLHSLRKQVSTKVAWLNPVPKSRWANTSAEYVRQMIPMFEVSPLGLNRAVQVLRGKITNPKQLIQQKKNQGRSKAEVQDLIANILGNAGNNPK